MTRYRIAISISISSVITGGPLPLVPEDREDSLLRESFKIIIAINQLVGRMFFIVIWKKFNTTSYVFDSGIIS
jgi:hypothetical protein